MPNHNVLYVFLSFLILGLAACTPRPEAPSGKDQVARGKYLVNAMGCGDCHSPHDEKGLPIAGKELSGHPAGVPLPSWEPTQLAKNALATIGTTATAFAGPFGVSVAPNLTPDPETGIGTLTAEALIASWRSGKHWKHDRPVLPPMPAQAFGGLDDADIRAIHAYLSSLPIVKNRAPESVPAQPVRN